jgi:hypothetical protein
LRPSTSGQQQTAPAEEHQSQLIEEAVDMDISDDEQADTHTAAADQPQVDGDESTMKQVDDIIADSTQKTHDYNDTESIHSIASLDESADELVVYICCADRNYLQQSPATSTSKPASVVDDGMHEAEDDLQIHETICDPFHPDTSSDVNRPAGESTECDVLNEVKPADDTYIHAGDTSHTINVDTELVRNLVCPVTNDVIYLQVLIKKRRNTSQSSASSGATSDPAMRRSGRHSKPRDKLNL